MKAVPGHRDYRHPPPRKSMHARIVRDLGMRIVSGEFEPGDRLPAERQLAEQFHVSRNTLREALRLGLIGLILLACLLWRSEGLVPEKLRKIP